MKTNLIVGLGLAGLQLAHAQVDSVLNRPPTTNQAQRSYYEQITYFTANHDYYAVRTFLQDSTLYRVDTYRVAEPANPLGNQLPIRKVVIHQGPTKIMYPTGQVYLSCDYESNVLHGRLMVYYDDGSVKRCEMYRYGVAKESHCYTQSGTEQPCKPLYQLPQLRVKPAQLKRYLEKSLASIAEETQLHAITIALTINELGQVSKTEVDARPAPADAKLTAFVLEAVRAMPQWNPGHTNWQPAQMDGVAIPEKWVVYISRKRGFLYVYLPSA